MHVPQQAAADFRGARALILGLGHHSRLSQILKPTEALQQMGFEVIGLGDTGADVVGGSQQAAATNGTAARSPREAAKRLLFSTSSGIRLRDWVRERRYIDSILAQNRAIAAEGVAVKPDLVISSQWDTLPAGKEIAEALRIPLVYDARDLADAWTSLPAIALLLVRLEGRAIHRADLVLAPSWSSADEIARRHRIEAPHVLFNSWDASASAASSPHSPIRLLFQGHFAENRCLEDLIDAMASLKGRCVLTLQGWGKAEAGLRRRVKSLGLERWVDFAEPVPSRETAIAAHHHDVGVINYRAVTKNLLYTIPNKLFDYMGGGLAVVSSDLPDIRRIVTDADCGVLFEPSGPEAIVDAVSQLSSDRERLAQYKRNSLCAWPAYSWDSQRPVFQSLINEIMIEHEG